MQELIFTIDQDVRRRASISYFLNNQGFRAEPFETIEEFARSLPSGGIILAHDNGGMIPRLMKEICSQQSWLPVVAYCETPQPERIVQTVLDGAIGYAAWPGCGKTMIATLRTASSRSQTEISRGSRRTLASAQIGKLSHREREILSGMVAGLSNRLISGHLGISPRTVELHRSNLLAKLGARHSAEAIRLAIEASLPAFEAYRQCEEVEGYRDVA